MATKKVIPAASDYTSMRIEMKAYMDGVMSGTVDRVSAKVYFYGAGKLVHMTNSQKQILMACGKVPDIPFAQ